jgi:hypothetical protein
VSKSTREARDSTCPIKRTYDPGKLHRGGDTRAQEDGEYFTSVFMTREHYVQRHRVVKSKASLQLMNGSRKCVFIRNGVLLSHKEK